MSNFSIDFFKILNIEFGKFLDIVAQQNELIGNQDFAGLDKLSNTLKSTKAYIETLMNDGIQHNIAMKLFVDATLMDRRNCISIRNVESLKCYLHYFGLPEAIFFGDNFQATITSEDYAQILIMYCIKNNCNLPKIKIANTAQHFEMYGVSMLQSFAKRYNLNAKVGN